MFYIYLKSYNVSLLNQFCKKFLTNKLKRLVKGPINLPKKSYLYTSIRSPHVYSLSREQFGLSVYRRLIILKSPFNFTRNFSSSDFIILEKNLLKYLPSGVSLKILFKNI